MTLAAKVLRARRLLTAVEKNHSPATFASRFGLEDMVVLDLVARDGLSIPVFLLDTGRLPRETLVLVDRVRKHYGLEVRTYHPWPGTLDAYAEQHGRDGFYDSVEARKACCGVRKTEPLRRALAGKRGWVSARRGETSGSAGAISETAFDPVHGIWKFSPLADWSLEDTWQYLRGNRVPYNALHDQGYSAIGCEPCTRAAQPGEPARAIRWWWENEAARDAHRLPEVSHG